jgi:hypothetical protein
MISYTQAAMERALKAQKVEAASALNNRIGLTPGSEATLQLTMLNKPV